MKEFVCRLQSGPSGIQEEFGESLTLFPNPTTGRCEIRLSHATPCLLRICDVSGKPVYEESYAVSERIHFDLQAPPGFYIATVETGKGKAAMKIMKW